jgi:hypothetical protein
LPVSVADSFSGKIVEFWGEGDDITILSVDGVLVEDSRSMVYRRPDGVLQAEYIPIEISESGLASLAQRGYETSSVYGMGKLNVVGDDGSCEIEPFSANLAPFPNKKLSIDWYAKKDNANHLWGISLCGEYAFSLSPRFENQIVCFKLKTGSNKGSRVNAKIKDGYEFSNTGEYDPANRFN